MTVTPGPLGGFMPGMGAGAGAASGLAGMNPLMLMAVLSALGPGDPTAGMPSGGFGGIGAKDGTGGAYNTQSLGTMLANLRGLVPPAPTPPMNALS